MKKVMFSVLVLFSMIGSLYATSEELIVENNESANTEEIVLLANDEVKTYVAKIGDVNYETLDEAIIAANETDEIFLLSDATITVGKIDKDITIKGNGFKITVPRQESEEHGCLSLYKKFSLYNTTIHFTSEARGENDWSLHMAAGSIFNLYNSNVIFEQVGIYAYAVSTINLDNSKMTLSNMKYTSMMSEGSFSKLNIMNNSEFKIAKPMDINGITGYDILVDNSTLDIEDCANQGMVYGSLKLTNRATAKFINCTTAINLYKTNEVIVEGNSELYISKSAERAIMSQSRYTGLIVRSGSKLTVTESGYGWKKTDDEAKHYASKGVITMGVYGWYVNPYTLAEKLLVYHHNAVINFEDGAIVNITNNYVRGITFSGKSAYIGNTTTITNNGGDRVAVGGGIYNEYGEITISDGARIYNNHANTSSDDIYNNEKNAVINLIKTGNDWILDDCNDAIDNWYDDSTNARWNAHGETSEEDHILIVNNGKIEGKAEIKAAHNVLGKVIVKYLDKKTNKELSETIETIDVVGNLYITNAKDIKNYALVDVKGEVKGSYIKGTIEVIYYYEKVKGKVIAHYVDMISGEKLTDSASTTGEVESKYETVEKSFEYYQLNRVEGNTTGEYIDGVIEVTDYYEFVGGTGGNDEPEEPTNPDFPVTGVETNNTLEFTLLFSLISLIGTIIIRKKLI